MLAGVLISANEPTLWAMCTGVLGNLARTKWVNDESIMKIEDFAMLLVHRAGGETRLERSLPEAAAFSRDVVAHPWLLLRRIRSVDEGCEPMLC